MTTSSESTRSLAKALPVAFMLIFFVCLGLFTLASIYGLDKIHVHEKARVEQNFLNTQKEIIKREVDRAFDYIQIEQSRFEQGIQESMQALAKRFHERALSTADETGFAEEVNLAIETPTEEGGASDLVNILVDAEGKLIWSDTLSETSTLPVGYAELLDDIASMAKRADGFGIYHYPSKSEDEQLEQVSLAVIVQPLANSGWYAVTFRDVSDGITTLQKELLESISKIRFGDYFDGYLFAFRYDGLYLMHAAKKYIGQNLIDIEDPSGFKINREIVKLCREQGNGYLSYVWDRYSKKTLIQKISYVRGHQEWQWAIGTGFYLDDLDEAINAQKAIFDKGYHRHLIAAGLFLLLSMLVVATMSRYFSRRIASELGVFVHYFSKAAHELRPIDIQSLSFSEFKELAGSVNNMIDARHVAEGKIIEAKNRAQEYLDIAGSIIVAIDTEQRITLINSKGCSVLCYQQNDIIEKNWFDTCIPDAVRKDAVAVFNELMAGNLERFEYFENQVVTSSGDQRAIAWQNTLITDDQGAIIGILSSGVDITERKLAETEKERLQRELQQKHKMEAVGQLTGGIAHDFNNILGIIMGFTSMALERYGRDAPEKMTDYLETAMKASGRARDLVAQMLDFSRSGNEDAQPLQLIALVNENVKMLYSVLPSSIKIELSCQDELPGVLMNPTKFQQLMMNLCGNAKDAMEGVGTLTISLGWHRGVDSECSACYQRIKGDWIELSVADTGCGMTAGTIKHLFEPFFTTKETGKGTGMGMAVLHGIVCGYGGHILVETELDKGTTFRLLFRPITEETPEIPELNPSSDKLPQGAGRHVLVVDDEPQLAEFIGELMELNDYRTTIKTDGQEALSLFQENPNKFSLLVTDQTMPGLTGIELIKKIKEVRPDFPVILCSGHSDTINKDKAEKMGIRYLGKPIYADMLIQSAGELLELTKSE